ncbi:MAG: hypothetical protein JW776_04180 [Candidatus Lokiarchaeota archaeon]|nr:hypothetical protein [Candidatus Lokiarchaeota archaeon]
MARKKKDTTESLNVSSKFENVKILYNTGRIKEAIAYLYTIYTDLALQKYGVRKTFSQTVRDFAIIMVKQYGQDPANIYPFIQQIEKAIYGGYPSTPAFFLEIVKSFENIYREMSGHRMPSLNL